MRPDELLTKKDLEEFKRELFEMLAPLKSAVNTPERKWLKNTDVKKLLNISSGTLQNLRVKGTLPHNKIGSIYYYKQEDIDRMLNGDEKKSPKQKK